MKIITKAYKCDFCGRVFATASGAKRHEDACKKNPQNQCCCPVCQHLKKKEYVYRDETGYPSHKETVFTCEKKNMNLFHPKVLRMLNPRRETITENAEMMPLLSTGCDCFKDQWDDTMDAFDEILNNLSL